MRLRRPLISLLLLLPFVVASPFAVSGFSILSCASDNLSTCALRRSVSSIGDIAVVGIVDKLCRWRGRYVGMVAGEQRAVEAAHVLVGRVVLLLLLLLLLSHVRCSVTAAVGNALLTAAHLQVSGVSILILAVSGRRQRCGIPVGSR